MRDIEYVRTDEDGVPHPIQKVRYVPHIESFEITFLNNHRLLIPLDDVVPGISPKNFQPNVRQIQAAEQHALKNGQQYFFDYKMRALEKKQARATADSMDEWVLEQIHPELKRPQDSPTI